MTSNRMALRLFVEVFLVLYFFSDFFLNCKNIMELGENCKEKEKQLSWKQEDQGSEPQTQMNIYNPSCPRDSKEKLQKLTGKLDLCSR